MKRLLTLATTLFTFAVGMAVGMLLVPPPSGESAHSHDHSTTTDIAAGDGAPALDFDLMKDPASGWNIHLHLANFNLAPQNASTANVDGEGHGHIYVNDIKVARLYSDWFHLADLSPGDAVTITLNSNDHSEISVGGEKLAVTKTVP